jgi:hypothetical protein
LSCAVTEVSAHFTWVSYCIERCLFETQELIILKINIKQEEITTVPSLGISFLWWDTFTILPYHPLPAFIERMDQPEVKIYTFSDNFLRTSVYMGALEFAIS